MTAQVETVKSVHTIESMNLAGLTTKSSQIRFLASEGMSRGDISRLLEIRYQHVRNVLITPIKKS